jgi:acetyl esterase
MGELTAETVRAEDLAILDMQAPKVALPRVEEIEAFAGSPVLIRLYRPLLRPLPMLIYLHGGGFVCDAVGYDRPLRRLALETEYMIAVPHVRLAPEHPFPAALEDAVASARWLTAHVSELSGSGIVGVAGDSSGGNLAASATRALAAEGMTPSFQVLIYPMLDAAASSASYRQFARGYGFTREKSLWYFRQYNSTGVDPRDPRLSPLFCEDFSGLPRTLVISAEYDPLRDEGEEYADRIRRAGGMAEVLRYEGMTHGFFQMDGVVKAAREVRRDIGRWLRNEL